MTLQIVQKLEQLRQVESLSNKVIAYPTESVFGLGCRVDKNELIEQIVSLKGRKANKGFVVLATDINQLKGIVDLKLLPKLYKHLPKQLNFPAGLNPILPGNYVEGVDLKIQEIFNKIYHWSLRGYKQHRSYDYFSQEDQPKALLNLRCAYHSVLLAFKDFINGNEFHYLKENKIELFKYLLLLHNTGQGITLLLPAAAECPQSICGGFATVAVRFTNHPFLKELIETMGGAIVSTSANYSGHDSLTRGSEVYDMLFEERREYLTDNVVILDHPVLNSNSEINESIIVSLIDEKLKEKLEKIHPTSKVLTFGIWRNYIDLFGSNFSFKTSNIIETIKTMICRMFISLEVVEEYIYLYEAYYNPHLYKNVLRETALEVSTENSSIDQFIMTGFALNGNISSIDLIKDDIYSFNNSGIFSSPKPRKYKSAITHSKDVTEKIAYFKQGFADSLVSQIKSTEDELFKAHPSLQPIAPVEVSFKEQEHSKNTTKQKTSTAKKEDLELPESTTKKTSKSARSAKMEKVAEESTTVKKSLKTTQASRIEKVAKESMVGRKSVKTAKATKSSKGTKSVKESKVTKETKSKTKFTKSS